MVVLFGALCVGNPFLACRDGTSPVESTTAAAPSTERIDPAVEKRAVLVASPSSNEALALDATAAVSAHRPKAMLASDPPRSQSPAEAAIERASAATRPTRRSGAAVEELECPDEELRPLVARTERHDGVLVWVLHDGRRFRRNPKLGAGEPRLVPFVVAVADDPPE